MYSSRKAVLNFCKKLLTSTSCTPVLIAHGNISQTVQACRFSMFKLKSIQDYNSLCSKINVRSTISTRNYAKGKDKKKEKGKGKVAVNESQLAEVVNIETLKNLMQKAVVHMEEDFTQHLSLRSTTGAIESIPVELDGKEHTLQELAQIVRKNPKTIVLNFTVFPQAIPAALKALSKSGMNLNPQQDGTTLFIPIPKVTKEHREQLAKNAKQIFVKCKDSVREVQIKFIKQVKKQGKISEDLARNVEQQIVAIADQFIADAEHILQRKQTELIGEK